MPKWTINYTVIDSEGNLIKKTTELYGTSVFDVYSNASRLLPIIERGNKIKKLEVINY